MYTLYNGYQYKRRTLQRLDGTNFGITNVGLVQTSDWDKRRTGANVGAVQKSDGYIYKEKDRTLVEFEKKTIAIRNKLKVTYLL